MVSLSKRTAALVGSGLVIVGALLLGEAVHVAFVRGTYAPGAPPVVLRVVVGAALVAIGYRLDVDPREYIRGGEAARADDGAEHDPELSPLSGESAERLAEREREREGDGG